MNKNKVSGVNKHLLKSPEKKKNIKKCAQEKSEGQSSKVSRRQHLIKSKSP